MTAQVELCPSTGTPPRRCTCPEHLGGRAVIDGVQVVSPERQPCGTRAGFLTHRRHHEPACRLCLDANAAYRREHFPATERRNRIYQQATREATKRLKGLNRPLWRRLLNEEINRLELAEQAVDEPVDKSPTGAG